MDTSQIPLMAALQSRMHYLGARHAVIAQNIANVDTPGYVPRDLKAPSFSELVMGGGAGGGLAMTRTNPMHMGGGGASAMAFKSISRKPSAETKPNGNQVSVENEVEQMSMNQDDYQEATALYRKTIAMFNTAVGKPSGQ